MDLLLVLLLIFLSDDLISRKHYWTFPNFSRWSAWYSTFRIFNFGIPYSVWASTRISLGRRNRV